MQVKEESEKVGLKLNIQKIKIMASNPITSWQIDVETVADFIFLGSKITVDGDCSMKLSHECMFLGSLSRHNKDLERQTLKPSACHSSRVLDKPCYSS